jgi:ribosome-associated protein
MTLYPDLDALQQWWAVAAQAADSKKATNTIVLDVGAVLAITDAFIITSAPNDRQVRTIVEEIEAAVKRAGGPSPIRIEGLREAQWVLMDYGDFVVHVFLQEARDYYDLERLWSDAPRVEWDRSRIGMAAGR